MMANTKARIMKAVKSPKAARAKPFDAVSDTTVYTRVMAHPHAMQHFFAGDILCLAINSSKQNNVLNTRNAKTALLQ
jgi:hypothetical protein